MVNLKTKLFWVNTFQYSWKQFDGNEFIRNDLGSI